MKRIFSKKKCGERWQEGCKGCGVWFHRDGWCNLCDGKTVEECLEMGFAIKFEWIEEVED